MSFKIKVIMPSTKEAKGVFFAADEESNPEINLAPLLGDLKNIFSMLDSLSDGSHYAVDEVSLTAGVTKEDTDEKSARVSVGLFQLGGEGTIGKETCLTENRLLEIKIKRVN